MAMVLSAVAVVTSKWAVAPLSAAVALSTVAASKDWALAFYWLAHRGLRIVLHVQLGGDLLARPGESGQLDAAVKLNAFQGTVRLTGSGSNSVAAPAGYRHACGANSACEAGPGLAFFVGSQTGCNATHDYDCTYQELNVTEGGATVTVD